MQICEKCLYPANHPFGLEFRSELCSGCNTHEEKNTIDWDLKYEELKQLLKQYKKFGRQYDCVIPVVGDAEDYYVISLVLELGLSPLVVCVNDYFKNDIGWYNLHNLITHFDVDSVIHNPDIYTYKELIKTSLRKFNHILLPFIQLHSAFPVHIAHERNIPLVIWGQNQAVEQVGKFSHYDSVEMSKWSRKEHDLFGVEIETLIGNGAQVNTSHINYYKYPNINQISRKGLHGIYLSNYIQWDPLKQNNSMKKFDFQPQLHSSSFDTYERAGSSVYYTIHDILKFKRTGYRKIHDHTAREIRHKRITTNEGQAIINYFNNSKINIQPFFTWLGATQSGYEWFVKHNLFDISHLITDSTEEPLTYENLPSNLSYFMTDFRLPQKDYIIFGKGI